MSVMGTRFECVRFDDVMHRHRHRHHLRVVRIVFSWHPLNIPDTHIYSTDTLVKP